MRKWLFAALILVIGLLFLVACTKTDTPDGQQDQQSPPAQETSDTGGTQQSPGDGGAQQTPEESPGTAEGPVVGPKGTGVPIVIYSNSFTDERLEWLTERAAVDGFVIQGVPAGGGATADRLIAEKYNPIADVVFGLNIFLWQSLIENDVLVKYVPAWAGEIPEGLNNADGYYHALVIQAILLAYDKDQVSNPPGDWLDLWTDPQYLGRYQFEAALTGGTTRMVIAGILGRFTDPSGYLGVSAEGWNHIEQYYARGYANLEGVDLYAQMADPEVPVAMGQIWHAGIPLREEEYGINSGWAVPSVGVPFVVEGIAEVKGASNPEEARRFIEWFGTAQIQIEWQKRFDSLPANKYATNDLDDFQTTISALKIQDVDWGYVAEHIDAWAEHIMLTYMP